MLPFNYLLSKTQYNKVYSSTFNNIYECIKNRLLFLLKKEKKRKDLNLVSSAKISANI